MGKSAQEGAHFCSTLVSKNGTRMKKHIEVCKKCDEQVKLKYLNRTAPDPEVDPEILEIEQNFNVTID